MLANRHVNARLDVTRIRSKFVEQELAEYWTLTLVDYWQATTEEQHSGRERRHESVGIVIARRQKLTHVNTTYILAG